MGGRGRQVSVSSRLARLPIKLQATQNIIVGLCFRENEIKAMCSVPKEWHPILTSGLSRHMHRHAATQTCTFTYMHEHHAHIHTHTHTHTRREKQMDRDGENMQIQIHENTKGGPEEGHFLFPLQHVKHVRPHGEFSPGKAGTTLHSA